MGDDTLIRLPGGPQEEFNALWQDFAWLHYQWTALRELYATDQERIDLMNDWAPSFFGMVRFVLQDSIFLGIDRLLQPAETARQENLTLEHLVNRVDDPTLADELRNRLAEILAIAAPVTKHRHKRIGHRDLAVALRTRALPLIERKHVEDTFTKIEAFMNRIEAAFSSVVPVPLDQIVDNAGGPNALLDALRRAQEHLEAEERRHGVPPRSSLGLGYGRPKES